MAATVEIYSIHTGVTSDSTTDIGAMRFKLADNDTEDLNDPCRIPTADQVALEIPNTFSFRKHLKLFFDTAPANSVTNLRFFTDGDENGELGTGIFLLGDSTCTTFHEHASGDSTGDATCTWLIVGGAAAHNWTKDSPQVVNAGTVITDSAPAVPNFGTQNYVTLQVMIDANAAPGTYPSSGTRTLSYRYDEN